MSNDEIDMSGLAVQTAEGALVARITVFENQALAAEATGKACTSINDQLRVVKGFADYVPDLSTTAGDKEARAARALCVACRTGAKKTWDLASAPLKAVSAAGLRMVKDIEMQVREIEEPLDAAIKIEEDRKEQEKIAKAQAEANRIKKIQDLLSIFRSWPVSMIGSTSAEIQDKIARSEKSVINEDVFQEFTKDAQSAKSASIAQLTQLLASTLEQEEKSKELLAAKAEEAAKDSEIAELRRLLAEMGADPTKPIHITSSETIDRGMEILERRRSGETIEEIISTGQSFIVHREEESEAEALFADPPCDKVDATMEQISNLPVNTTPEVNDDESTGELLSAVEDALVYHDAIVEILATAQNTQTMPNHMKFRAFVVSKCKEVLEA